MDVTSLLSLCSGYGGLDIAIEDMFGATTIAHAEIDPLASRVLNVRWPEIPNLGDLTTADWSHYVGVDIVAAGFPCQDLSYAGKGAGITEGTRSGLWYKIADALCVLRPRWVVLENVSAIVGRRPGLDVVLAGLASLGFDAVWTCVRASDVGAPHRRERWFLVATDPSGKQVGAAGFARPRTGLPSANAGGERHGGGKDGREVGRLDRGDAGEAWERERSREVARHRSTTAAADADVDGLDWITQLDGTTTSRLDGQPGRHAYRRPVEDPRCPGVGEDEPSAWGDYGPAIERWERVIGRPAPRPTDDRGRLNSRFVEFLMGLPDGWVTGTPGLSRSQQLKVLGNGVVPQQAAFALKALSIPTIEQVWP